MVGADDKIKLLVSSEIQIFHASRPINWYFMGTAEIRFIFYSCDENWENIPSDEK